jgi:hypothetical protein
MKSGCALPPAELRSWLYEACGKGFGGTEWAHPSGASPEDRRRPLRQQAKPADGIDGRRCRAVVGAYHGVRPLRHGVTNMTVDDFRQSLTAAKPPAELTLALAGLWWDAKGDWPRAHESAQQDEGIEGSWVHAYLHRKEGDPGKRSLLVRSGRQARFPRATGSGMARHCESFAGID